MLHICMLMGVCPHKYRAIGTAAHVCSPNSQEANTRKPLSSKTSLNYTVSPGLYSKRL